MDGQGLLEGRTALVTGAARGLGLEIARQLVAHGAKVWLNGREKAALDQAAGDIGQGAEALPFDI
ncbi:MAG TPA: gluconate 5-dehydrogenase, partial [Erythrobacter sp.]|nr:gluconate 5-dehydrogenase [Erythrobacter sp.]